jgi:MarR family transcriptional regulator for hemolysin
VAEDVGLEPSSVVRLIDNLVASGYVERRSDKTDRRAKLLFLTERGKAIVTPLEAELANLRNTLLKDMTDEEFAVCQEVFQKLNSSIKEHRDAEI